MTNIKQRNLGLDFIKGICIILVVLIHAMDFDTLPPPLPKLFNAFFLKCFFCVSGYLVYNSANSLKNGGLTERIKKRFISLIIPYVVFSVLAIMWHIIICVGLGCTEVSDEYFGWSLIFRDIFCAVSGLGIGTLWFLPVLFVSYVLLALTVYFTNKNKKMQVVLMCIGFIAFALLSNYVQTLEISASGLITKMISKYTNTIYRILYGYDYMILGYLIHILYDKISTRKKLYYILMASIALTIIGYIFNIKLLLQLGTCSFITLGSVTIFDNQKINGTLSKIFKPIIYCGKNSLSIMIYHYIFLFPIEKMILNYFCGGYNNEWIFFAFNLLSTLIIVWLLRNNKTEKWLLGKNGLKIIR